MMANLGTIKVIAELSIRKQEEDINDCWDEISMVRISKVRSQQHDKSYQSATLE
jgi:hypothetical protein